MGWKEYTCNTDKHLADNSINIHEASNIGVIIHNLPRSNAVFDVGHELAISDLLKLPLIKGSLQWLN